MKSKIKLLLAFLVLILGYNTTVVSQDVSSGLVGYWPLDEGADSITVDASGNNDDGKIHGAAAWVSGMFGKALSFNGLDDYVDCGNNTILEFGVGDFTISAWVKTNQFEDRTIFGKGGDDAGGRRYHLVIDKALLGDANGTIWFILDDDGDEPSGVGKYDPGGTTEVADDKWHHIVAFRDSLTLRLYVDGAEDEGMMNHPDITLPQNYAISNTQYNAYIGCLMSNDPSKGGLNKFFSGIIDDVAIWNRTLTTEEIEYLYNNGDGNPVMEAGTNGVADVAQSKSVSLKNYPNPFNSITTFSFKLQENSHAKLKVYNSLGQEVVVLLDGMRSAGTHKVQFDGSGLTDGIYFAELQTGSYSKGIMILLIK